MSSMYRSKSAIIACHEIYSIGPARDLVDYLTGNKINRLLYISHPLIFKKGDPFFFNKEAYKNTSKILYYKSGKVTKKKYALHWNLPEPLLYIKDFLYTIIWPFLFKGKFDIFIGVDPLNALAGIILKRIGKVKKVIPYSIDYFPKRFENPLMNRIYHTMDYLSVKFSDETWNLSRNMALARSRYHKETSMEVKQREVPLGIKFNQIKRLPFNKINRKKIIYIGLINKITGVELIIKALNNIKKRIPNIDVEIYGEGPDEEKLQQLAKKLRIELSVKFHGWIKDRDQMLKLIADSAVGLVLFNPKIYKQEIQNADPMKVKDYMVLGMPIISTNVITSGKEIADRKCGIMINYDENDLTESVIKLLTNKKLLREYRRNAIKYIKQFDFKKIYDENLLRVLS